MTKKYSVLCKNCNTLAEPICLCEAVAAEYDGKFIAIYSNDLMKTELITLWEDETGYVHYMNKKFDFNTAKVLITPPLGK